jgi:thiaminase/transcriptional activator TenA
MSKNADYGKIFPLFRAASHHWNDYTRHAFVQGLGDGTLPKEAFLHFLKQDYIFLIHFSRAWALAVAKADTLDEMKACAGTVNGLVNGEMAFHVEFCRKAGISEAELLATVEASENLAYTRYVLEAGYSGDFLSLLAALGPCVFGYGEIGLMLAKEKTSDTYIDWINTYAGDEYQSVCKNVGTLLDNAIALRLGDDFATVPMWDKLSKQFDVATCLEVSFWDMGLKPSSRKAP